MFIANSNAVHWLQSVPIQDGRSSLANSEKQGGEINIFFVTLFTVSTQGLTFPFTTLNIRAVE